jgi:molybdopterin molybdotransferase
MPEFLDADEARAKMLAAVTPLSAESVGCAESAGRWLAEDVVSNIPMPRWDQSSMDGYAARSADLTVGRRLRVAGRTSAGDPPGGFVEAGAAWRIFTGAPLPKGADCVVMQEDCDDVGEGCVVIRDPATAWENVRVAGEEFRPGECLLRRGERIAAGGVAVLAGAGAAKVLVTRRPTVAIIAVGSELRAPGESLEPGSIYDSNSVMLGAMVAAAGGVSRLRRVADVQSEVEAALIEGARDCDVVLTSGGASVGELDITRNALAAAGGRIEMWRLNLKPGKPLFCGSIRSRIVLGLPGNPVSAFVTAVLFLQPILRRLQGAARPGPSVTLGVLGERIAHDGGRPHYMRMMRDASGRFRSAGVQASHRIRGLAAADALYEAKSGADVPEGTVAPLLTWCD